MKVRLKGLKPEEIMDKFDPETRLKGISVNDRLSGLSADELKILKEKLKDI